MKCIIGNPNLKVWSKMINTMSVTGDEDIRFCFKDSSVTLTTFDASLAVCVTCTFNREFFTEYRFRREAEVNLRVPSKCILKPFRSMRFLTKSCTSCELLLVNGKESIVIAMTCKSGAEVRYTIPLSVDNESMEVDFDVDALKNWIKTEPKLVIGSLSNFSHSKGLIDLTLKVQRNKVFLKNCATDLVKKEGKIYTELCLSAIDFEEFNIGEEGEVTFPLREFKTFAAFSDFMKLPMSVNFQSPHDPVIITVKSDILVATMTLATKVLNLDTQCSSQSTDTSNGRISNVSSQDSKGSNRQQGVAVQSERSKRLSRTSDVAHLLALQHSEDAPGITPLYNNNETESEVLEVSRIQSEPAEADSEIRRTQQKRRDNDVLECPPSKRLKDLFPRMGKPFDLLSEFDGQHIVLAPDSDEDE